MHNIVGNNKNKTNSNNSNIKEIELLKDKIELLEKSLKNKERIISMLEKN